MNPLTKRMADKHEGDVTEWFGARRTPGSGNQWHRQTDARQHRREVRFAFAIDGKATRSRTHSITRETIDKLVDQAHAERPLLALRWYFDDRLTDYDDWALVRVDDLLEILEAVEREP